MELGGGDIESDGDLGAGFVTSGLDRLHEQFECHAILGEIGGEASLITDVGRKTLCGEDLVEGVIGLHTRTKGITKCAESSRHEHELLHVDRVGGVGASVEDVQHRNWEGARRRTPEIAIQRHARSTSRGAGVCQGHRKDGVRSEAGLVRGAVEVAHGEIERGLVERVASQQHRRDGVVDVLDGPRHALPAEAGSAVSKLMSFERPQSMPPRELPHDRSDRQQASPRPQRSGSPRESRTSRARIELIVVTGPPARGKVLRGRVCT